MCSIIDASRPCAWFLKALQMAAVSEMTGWCIWLRFISFHPPHHAAPSGWSAISVSHLCKQASAHVYTCVLIKQPCARKVHAQHTCMHAVDRLPLHRQNCSGGSCLRQRRVIKPPLCQWSMYKCTFVCECVLFAALSGVGGLICSTNIDRQGIRSSLQGVLLPFHGCIEKAHAKTQTNIY